MTKKLAILILNLSIFMTSCGQMSTNNQQDNTGLNNIDTSIFAVLPYNSKCNFIFKNCEPSDLTSEDLQKIENLLTKCIIEYNDIQEMQFEKFYKDIPEFKNKKNNFFIDLKNYKRQYVGILNSKGEKEVWVNCFCYILNAEWRKHFMFVKDGGNCFFNLKINLTKGIYYELKVNGSV